MIRFTLLAVLVLSAAALCLPNAAPSAVPTAKPTPVGLQYDEITRMAVPPGTPPPPGSFGNDYAAIMNPPAQANAEEQPDAEAAAAMNAMGIKMPGGMPDFTKGKLTRFAFFKGWIRTDDVMAKTAEIRKCDLHQFIELDLKKKTYRVSNQSAADAAASSDRGGNMGPGTAVMSSSQKGTALGPMTLENVATQGYHVVNTMSISKATGSCQNASFGSVRTEYVSGIHEPRTFCELPRTELMGVSKGGCRPTFGKLQNSGAVGPTGKLVMYSKTAILPSGSSDEQAAVSAFVTERGNVNVLYIKEATALFSVPADFTKEP